VNVVDPDFDPPPGRYSDQPDRPSRLGIAGSSARREYERRAGNREQRLRDRWGGLAVEVSPEPQSTRAWEQGAIGEERLGARLDAVISDHLAIPHDRRIRGTKANIDHLVITRASVWVVDAKRYKGRTELRNQGGILRPQVKRLLVGRRDRTKLVDGVLKPVDLVRTAVPDVPVTGTICSVDADRPLIGGSLIARDIHVLWPKKLAKSLASESAGHVDVSLVCRELAARFPAA
jgi:hypothetical protein